MRRPIGISRRPTEKRNHSDDRGRSSQARAASHLAARRQPIRRRTPHRHCEPDRGWLFGTSLWLDDELRSVAIAGRPKGRGYDDGRTIEITRVCTLGDPNACSILYGALCRAAKALGYQRAVTYTLADEPGTFARCSWIRARREPAGTRHLGR